MQARKRFMTEIPNDPTNSEPIEVSSHIPNSLPSAPSGPGGSLPSLSTTSVSLPSTSHPSASHDPSSSGAPSNSLASSNPSLHSSSGMSSLSVSSGSSISRSSSPSDSGSSFVSSSNSSVSSLASQPSSSSEPDSSSGPSSGTSSSSPTSSSSYPSLSSSSGQADDVTLEEVHLLGTRHWDMVRDKEATDYDAPHWRREDPDDDDAKRRFPHLYRDGGHMKLKVIWENLGHARGTEYQFKGKQGAGATAFTFPETDGVLKGKKKIQIVVKADKAFEKDKVRFFNTFDIQWQVRIKKGAGPWGGWQPAGTSDNPVYVCLEGGRLKKYRSVVHLACSVEGGIASCNIMATAISLRTSRTALKPCCKVESTRQSVQLGEF